MLGLTAMRRQFFRHAALCTAIVAVASAAACGVKGPLRPPAKGTPAATTAPSTDNPATPPATTSPALPPPSIPAAR
jgi:predicted small lipoprotein YifL